MTDSRQSNTMNDSYFFETRTQYAALTEGEGGKNEMEYEDIKDENEAEIENGSVILIGEVMKMATGTDRKQMYEKECIRLTQLRNQLDKQFDVECESGRNDLVDKICEKLDECEKALAYQASCYFNCIISQRAKGASEK